MLSIAGDPFLDELHDMVEQARADHRAQVEQDEQARLEREARAQELVRHIRQRFSAVASSVQDSDQGIEYTRHETPEDEGLPVTHTLHWRVTRPRRKLEARVSMRTGRYWFHLLAVDACGGAGQVVEDSHGDVVDVTAADVDQLIRRLADQQAWQGSTPAASNAGG